MQLRYETGLTGEQYVRAQAWRDATLKRCPNHPHGNCSLARHGTYTRKSPRGTHIARWYCPESHTTFSLLPDCLAARLPGELDEVEAVVAHAEHAPSLAAVANELRRDAVELPGAMRWVARRVRLVHHVLSIVIGLLPDLLARCVTEVGAVRTRLETETALRTLRRLPSQATRALRRRRRGVLSPLPLPRAPTPCAPVRRRRARWRTHLHHNHRDHRGIGARVRAGSPTMTGQCEKSTHGRPGINREIRYETTWDTTPLPAR